MAGVDADRSSSRPVPLLPSPRHVPSPACPRPPLTSLVGREHEVATVGELLCQDEVRLLTLTGPGGVGKTRLALRVADELAGAFADGAAFVPLAAVRDPALVVPTVAHALGLREAGDGPLNARLRGFLGSRELLLVLDNFEQVLAAGTAIAGLLAACPGLTVLATSRAPLRVSGERELRVPPLALPDRHAGRGIGPDRPAPFEELARSEAVRLFAERAQSAQAHFALTADNVVDVVEICRRLDGLPLAIELAAARIKAFPPATLLARLERRLPLLTGGTRDAPQRLRTMRDAIGWSYDLLAEEEQTLFRRLAVFAGGFTLAAAEAIGDATGDLGIDTLDGVAALVDLSLVQWDAGDEPRFGMLETVREFGLERLAESGEEAATRCRHALWFLALAEAVAPRQSGVSQRGLERLGAERDNLRAALAWATAVTAEGGPSPPVCDGPPPAEIALRLAGELAWWWRTSGQLTEGRDWLARARAAAAGQEGAAIERARARALIPEGQLATLQGDPDGGFTLATEGLRLARAGGEEWWVAYAEYMLSFVEGHRGNRAAAIERAQEALRLFRALDDEGGQALALNRLALERQAAGDAPGARPLLEEARTRWRAAGNGRGEATAIAGLAGLARGAGDLAQAAALYHEATGLYRDWGDRWGLIECLTGLADVAGAGGQAELAARLAGAADALAAATGLDLPPAARDRLDRALAAAETALGTEAAGAARDAGRRLPPEGALAEATAVGSTAAVEPVGGQATPPTLLTPREQDVLRLLAAGRSNPEIADALFIGRGTVGTHVSHILAKLGAATRTEAADLAHRRGLL